MRGRSSGWDLSRFVRTLSYFGAVPILSQVDWFQQWLGSRSDPTVDSRSLIAAMPVSADGSAMPQTAMPQTILVMGTADWLTALVDRLTLQGKSVRVLAIDDVNLPVREGVEGEAVASQFPERVIDLQQPLAAEQIADVQAADVQAADVQAIIAAIQSETLVEPAVRFLLQAVQPLAVRLPIFDFSHPSGNWSEIWGALDDVVMGGVSQSGIRFQGGVADFSGQVSTANSGGFASVRTRNLEPSIDLSGYDGIELRLKGDGNRYKFMLRDETRWDGVAHCASFDTLADDWITVHLPFSTLIPVFRARTLKEASLKLDRICAFQMMLSKFEYDGALNPHFQPGFFQLQVQSIAAYKQSYSLPFVLVCPPSSEAEVLLHQSGLPILILRPAAGDTAETVAEGCVKAIDSLITA